MGPIDIDACYKKYAPMIFRRCTGILGNEEEALDAVQDVFIKLLRHRQKLHGEFLSSLLYIMATNTCLNRLRQIKRQNTVDMEALSLAAHDPEFEKVETEMLMDDIFKSESESTRAICFMYHRDNMTLKEIGELVGLSVSGVRKRLCTFNERAKRKWEGGNANER